MCLAYFFARHPRSSHKLAHPSQSVPLGYRDTKRGIIAGSTCDQGSEEQKFSNKFLQLLGIPQAEEASPGT